MTELKACVFIHLLTYCMQLNISHEAAVIGENVRDARPSDKLSFVVSIARKARSKYFFENLHFCTGTLISKRSVLTARHCLENKKVKDIVITAALKDASSDEKYYPKSWVTFNEWSGNPGDKHPVQDIAVITLQRAKSKYPKITTASVMLDPIDLCNSTIRLIGWGDTENGGRPSILKTALLNVISNEECTSKSAELGKPYSVPSNYFCSTAIPYVLSSCGDSGAPILNMKNEVVGMHIGVCPDLKGHSSEFKILNQYNVHLYLHFYKEFIEQARVN